MRASTKEQDHTSDLQPHNEDRKDLATGPGGHRYAEDLQATDTGAFGALIYHTPRTAFEQTLGPDSMGLSCQSLPP